jgi:hypothetical protein
MVDTTGIELYMDVYAMVRYLKLDTGSRSVLGRNPLA